MRLAAPAVLLCLALAGCGAGETASDSDAAPPSLAAPEPSRCVDVTPALLAAIAAGAEKDVGKLTLTVGSAVKSNDFENVFIVAAAVFAPGVDGETGVWATNSLTPGKGTTLAVDGFAKQFAVWPDGDKSSAGVTLSADGVDEAKECL